MNFSITQKLDTREYAKMMFIGLNRKPAFIVSTIVGLYLLITVLLDHLKVINYDNSSPLYDIIIGALLLLAPTLIVIITVNQFKSNPNFQNDMTFTFGEELFVVQGITFKSEVSWVHITKQKEIGKFLILYHTKKFGNIIDKSKLTTEQLLFIKAKVAKK